MRNSSAPAGKVALIVSVSNNEGAPQALAQPRVWA